MGLLELYNQSASPEAQLRLETAVASIPVYRRDPDGGLRDAGQCTPTIVRGTDGLAARLHGPVAYSLDQIERWPFGESVCVYEHGAESEYVRTDELHRAVCAALALRLAVTES